MIIYLLKVLVLFITLTIHINANAEEVDSESDKEENVQFEEMDFLAANKNILNQKKRPILNERFGKLKFIDKPYTTTLKNIFEVKNPNGFYFFAGYPMVVGTVHSIKNNIGEKMNLQNQGVNAFNNSFYLSAGARIFVEGFFAGFEGFYMEPHFQNHDIYSYKFTSIAKNNAITNIVSQNVNIDRFKTINRIYGANMRLGFGIPRFVVFGIIGFGVADITDTQTINSFTGTTTANPSTKITSDTLSSSYSTEKIGLNYGCGFDFFITNNFFVRMEYQEFLFNNTFTSSAMPVIKNAQSMAWSEDSTFVFRNLIIGAGLKF